MGTDLALARDCFGLQRRNRHSRLETRPYAPYDLYWLDDTTPAGWFDATGLRRLADPSLSVSFYEEGVYCGSAGLFRLWSGVYEAWLVVLVAPTDAWSFMTQLQHAIQRGQRLTGAHRLQAYCLADYTPGLALAKRMGFVREAVLACATPTKTDLIVLAKVRR